MSNYRRALAFHLRIGDRPPPAPTTPDAATLALRLRLLREEALEVQEALTALTATTTADARRPVADEAPAGTGTGRRAGAEAAAAHELADLLYVVYGTFVALGVDADEVFAEIHEANLRKAGAPRRPDGKQLRPDGWRPADVGAVLERQRASARQGRIIDELEGARAGD
jgi:predicted HAD superfamily Cof-like phosphohydrolase